MKLTKILKCVDVELMLNSLLVFLNSYEGNRYTPFVGYDQVKLKIIS